LNRYLDQNDEFTNFSDDPTATEEDWKKLRALRSSVLRHRAQLRLKRRDLKKKQLAKNSADEIFMKYVRSKRSSVQQDHTSQHDQLFSPILDSYYDAMQIARDLYGPAEDDYDILEDRVDEEEFELAKIEGRIYNAKGQEVVVAAAGQSLAAVDTRRPSPVPPDSLLGLSTDISEEYHPLHASYLSRLGDLDLARERHQNMTQDHESLTALQKSRRSVGLELDETTASFLAQFPAQDSALLGEIGEIEADVQRLKAECLAEGIDIEESDHESYQDRSGAGDDRGSNDDADIVLPDKTSVQLKMESSTFPLLLPESVEDKAKLGDLITDFDEGNKSDRINRWIQYQLQISPLQVELLVRVFLQVLNILDLRQWKLDKYQWQCSVIFCWASDEANKPPDAFQPIQTEASVAQVHPSITTRGRSQSNSAILDPAKTSNTKQCLRRTQSAPNKLQIRHSERR
jgi:hypothetical protein